MLYLTEFLFLSIVLYTYITLSKKLKGKEQECLGLNLEVVRLSERLISEEEKSNLIKTNLLDQLDFQKMLAQEASQLLNISKDQLSESFKATSMEVISNSNKEFLSLAEQCLSRWQQEASGDLNLKQASFESLVNPIKETLVTLDSKLNTVERERASSDSVLSEQLKTLNGVQESLRKETSNLVRALRSPSVRGRWGELQLKKVVEVSGMTEHCDFHQQVSVETEEGKLRPDMIITLPNKRMLVVDSKVPLASYIDSIEATDDESKAFKLKDHARQVKLHVNSLGLKAYWEQFPEAPEFVIMFLPGEAFLSAALEQDPDLLEYALQKGIILASPSSLVAVLKAVAYGWQNEVLAKNAQAICELGSELYDRVRTFTNNFVDIKRGLDKTVEAYNKSVNSLESRVLVTARRLSDLGVAPSEEIVEVEQVDKIPKLPSGS